MKMAKCAFLKFFSFLFHSVAGDNVPHSDSDFLLVIKFLTGEGKTSFKLFHISMATCIKNKLKNANDLNTLISGRQKAFVV